MTHYGAVCPSRRGDFGLFEQMDIDNDDNTTLKEFTDFLVRTHRAKRAKMRGSGDKWLKT